MDDSTDQRSTPVVQQVTKASSDKLLTKFSESNPDPSIISKTTSTLSKRQQLVQGSIRLKRTSRRGVMARIMSSSSSSSSPSSSSCIGNSREFRRNRTQMGERKTLLKTSSKSMLRPEFSARHIYAAEFVMAKLEKTWRKTIEGTSSILMRRHCSQRHVRLISDAV